MFNAMCNIQTANKYTEGTVYLLHKLTQNVIAIKTQKQKESTAKKSKFSIQSLTHLRHTP